VSKWQPNAFATLDGADRFQVPDLLQCHAKLFCQDEFSMFAKLRRLVGGSNGLSDIRNGLRTDRNEPIVSEGTVTIVWRICATSLSNAWLTVRNSPAGTAAPPRSARI